VGVDSSMDKWYISFHPEVGERECVEVDDWRGNAEPVAQNFQSKVELSNVAIPSGKCNCKARECDARKSTEPVKKEKMHLSLLKRTFLYSPILLYISPVPLETGCDSESVDCAHECLGVIVGIRLDLARKPECGDRL